MGLKERFLAPMDSFQRILLCCMLVPRLIIQILTYWNYVGYYYPQSIHISMFIAVVVLVLNPKGTRLLLFCFFAYSLMKIFIDGNQQYYPTSYFPPQCFFGLPMMWVGFSTKAILYSHIVLFSLLAYFSFNNPFATKKVIDSEILDQ